MTGMVVAQADFCILIAANKLKQLMADVRIKDNTILSGEKYLLKRVRFEKKKKDGSWQQQEREVFDHGNAVTALLYNKEHRTVILTRQFRIPTFLNGNSSGMLIEACAGLMEEDEHPDETIKREIREELGYAVGSVQQVGEGYSSPGSLTERVYFYLVPYDQSQKVSKGGGLEKEGEDVEVLEMGVAEALGLLAEGSIQDVKTILLLQYLQLHGLV